MKYPLAGLKMIDLVSKVNIGDVITNDRNAFGLQHDKFKTVKLEGKFTIVNINKNFATTKKDGNIVYMSIIDNKSKILYSIMFGEQQNTGFKI